MRTVHLKIPEGLDLSTGYSMLKFAELLGKYVVSIFYYPASIIRVVSEKWISAFRLSTGFGDITLVAGESQNQDATKY